MIKAKSRNLWVKERAIDFGEFDGITYWIAPGPVGGLNGYACFPQKPVKEEDYDGILSYVRVHGGITYCEHDEIGSVYGFDTSHYDSESYPRLDPQWIAGQCAKMIRGIRKAAEIEEAYLLSEGNQQQRDAIISLLDEEEN